MKALLMKDEKVLELLDKQYLLLFPNYEARRLAEISLMDEYLNYDVKEILPNGMVVNTKLAVPLLRLYSLEEMYAGQYSEEELEEIKKIESRSFLEIYQGFYN
jgi:hypothetical protein